MIYNATPTLSDFHRDDSFVRVVIGPVGSGKSSAAVVEALKRALEQEPGPDGVRRTRFAFIRNTYGQLRDTTRKTFEQWAPEGTWHEQSFTYTLDKKLSDGTRLHCEVLFRALDRPEDVKKLLSLELTGAYINELREVPKHVLDVLQTRVGRYPSKVQGGPTWFGVWADTNPWETSHWGYELFTKTRPEGYSLFEQPGGRSPKAENLENLPPGYYDRLVFGKDSEWVKSYVDGEYPSSAIGSVYGRALDKLGQAGGIVDFDYPRDGIFAHLDLGLSDATAIWFCRFGKTGLDVVDHYENHGEVLSHYFEILDTRGYQYTKFILPHDARQRSFQTGVGVVDQFISRYGAGKVAIGPEMSIAHGLEAGRWLLEQPTRIHATNCAEGLKALHAYRYDWDEDLQVLSRRPVHDWSSHTADAFRYMALSVKHTERMAKRKTAAEPKKTVRHTLEDLFEENGAGL